MSETKLAFWNANGLQQHLLELKAFIADKNLDIVLISETHFTEKSYVRIPHYKIYHTNHPAGTARGSAIIVRESISHTLNENFQSNHIQSTSITTKMSFGFITFAAIYCPPRHSINMDQYKNYFQSLGNCFIAGGDYNAKHTVWGSRIVSPKGRILFKTMQAMNLSHISSGSPTYWPSDLNKLPDLIDFCVTKGISANHTKVESSLELSSDHTPVLVTIFDQAKLNDQNASLHSKQTNWEQFRVKVSQSLALNISLKTPIEVEEAIQMFNNCIQHAAWDSTPAPNNRNVPKILSSEVAELIKNKRKLRKRWQQFRDPQLKKALNKAAKDLKSALSEIENREISKYLEDLSSSESSNFSLWKATRKTHQQTTHSAAIKMRNGEWARSNTEIANTFSEHLAEVFQPFSRDVSIPPSDDLAIMNFNSEIHNNIQSIAHVNMKQVSGIIMSLDNKKSPGYDLITAKILKELPSIGIKFLTFIFNAVLRLHHFPLQWKIAQVILILKPGKPQQHASSYRPISLLPILSKVMEIIILKRITPIIQQKNIIPDHQFGFRKHHSTIEQVNRVYSIARNSIEEGKYCTAVFIDVSQAFDKVWHPGLIFKLQQIFPLNIWILLKSYLDNRHFMVKHKNEVTGITEILSGVPQGSVLGPTLYTLYTSDLPQSNTTYTATYADDTVILSTHNDRNTASRNLQSNLNEIDRWLRKWRIKPNVTKSVQITFTLKRDSCPQVFLNNAALPQVTAVKYLGMHLDRRLTWKSHILMKRCQLSLRLRDLLWLIDKNSKMSLENKILVYKVILKPVWTYGIQLWGVAAQTNIDVIQRFQSKVLRIITNASKYISNNRIHTDLGVPTVKDEVSRFSSNYRHRLDNHSNPLARLLTNTENSIRRLKRYHINDLPQRFL